MGSASEIPDGSFKCVSCEGLDIDVFNLGGEFYAIGDVCTHARHPYALAIFMRTCGAGS